MEKEPQNEIFLDPRWSILEDGLGYQVLILGGIPSLDKDGKEIITFTIKPDDIVRKRYNWRGGEKGELDMNGNRKIIIAKIDLIPLNLYDDANKKWLYVKSFMHEETELSKREHFLKLEIKRLSQANMQLDAENIRVNEVNHILRTNPEKALSGATEVFEKVAEGLSKLNQGNKDK